MREFGVRRYGDGKYHHCMAESPDDAANWFAQAQPGLADKDFQALVKDFSRPVSDESGLGGNPIVVHVRHGARSESSRLVQDLNRTTALP